MENVKPSAEDISDLIAQTERLKQALESFRDKIFLTPIQHEAIRAGKAKDIALYLLKLNKKDGEKYLSNFCEIDSLFEDYTNPNRPSGCGPGIFIKTKKGFELYQGEAPTSHRYCFNIGALQEFLEKYATKEKKDCWNKYVRPFQYRLWNRLRRWRRFIKFNIRTDIIEIVDNLKIETLNKKTFENLEDVIIELEQIKTKNTITIAVAVKCFNVSHGHLLREIKEGRIKSYREKNAPKNAPHIVDAVEVSRRWTRRN